MTYKEALIYIEQLETNAYIPNHQNSLRLMAALGNPQDKMPVIHVAGTNGKGSTTAFMAEIFMAGGHKVGTFTSPHIQSPLELTSVNGKSITEEDFAESISIIRKACTQVTKEGFPHPTAFECLTAASLVYLSKATLDVAIIEVGMGGRFDATNVFTKPLLTLITAIDYDHTKWLGTSLGEIAWHKGGIIKPGVPTILAPNPIEVVTAISDIVRETGDKLYLMDEGFISEKVLMTTGFTKLFHLKSNFFDYKGLRTTMLGRHQTLNLATALLAVYQLRHQLPVTEKQIKEGILNTKWHCRGDILSTSPLIMVDGGHNMAAFESIDKLIQQHFANKRVITVTGILDDKDRTSMLDKLQSFSETVILTRPLSPRATPPSQLEAMADVIVIDAYEDALKKALELYDKESMILVLGSLYLAYPAKEWLLQEIG